MIAPARLVRLAAGDFAERSRTYAFAVTLLVMVWATNVFIPPLDSNYTTVDIQGHRGVYGSAWLGVQLSMLVNSFFGLIGFYLVKSAVDRDRRSGVGQLLAASPLSRVGYTLSKWLSNFLVLSSMLAVVAVCTALLQVVRGEDTAVNPVALLMPLVLLVLPFFSVVAALAVLFEVLPLARGGLGNIAYFFLWAFAGIMQSFQNRTRLEPFNDAMGVGLITPGIVQAAARAFPAEKITGEHMSLGINIGGAGDGPVVRFPYDGMEWTPEMVAGRLAWFGVGLVLAMLAALPFDRFGAEGAGAGLRAAAGRAWFGAGAKRAATGANGGDTVPTTGTAPPQAFDPARLATIVPGRRFDPFALVRAELTVALKGYPRLWYAGALALAIASLVAPVEGVRTAVAPMLAIWPMLLWSALGTREARNGTADLLFSSPRPLSRQLPATWLSGVAIGFVTGGAYGLRLLLSGDPVGALTWAAGIAFVPALALACGVITGNSRLFEGFYMAFWYVAALNHVPEMDYTGAMAHETGPGVAAMFAALTAGLFALAWVSRRRQLST